MTDVPKHRERASGVTHQVAVDVLAQAQPSSFRGRKGVSYFHSPHVELALSGWGRPGPGARTSAVTLGDILSGCQR